MKLNKYMVRNRHSHKHFVGIPMVARWRPTLLRFTNCKSPEYPTHAELLCKIKDVGRW